MRNESRRDRATRNRKHKREYTLTVVNVGGDSLGDLGDLRDLGGLGDLAQARGTASSRCRRHCRFCTGIVRESESDRAEREGRRKSKRGLRGEGRGTRYQCCFVGRTFGTKLTVVIMGNGWRGKKRKEREREGGDVKIYIARGILVWGHSQRGMARGTLMGT